MPDELREALTVSGVSALIPKQIDPLLLEYVRRYSPLVQAIPDKQWNTNQYFYNERTVLVNGGPVTDGGARAVANSTYVQNSFNIKLFQSVGAVTGFAQVVTRDLIGDLKASEVKSASRQLLWAIETAFLWGNASATASGSFPTCDGADVLVSQYSTSGGNPQNAIDEAHASLSLSILDNLIDLVESNAAAPVSDDSWMFVMSPRMNSKVQQLFSAQQRFDNAPMQVAGMNVPSYRGVPVIKSSFLGSRALTTATPTLGTTTGTLANATYFYRVSEVIQNVGETVASVEASQAANNQGVTITLGTGNTYDGQGATQYKVYRSTSAGAETLLGVVDAFDKTGAAVTAIIDSGTNLLTNSSGNTGPSAYVSTNAGQFPRNSNDEDIYLLPRDPDILVRPWTRWMQFINLAPTTAAPDTLPFAIVADTALAVRAPKYVGRVSRVSSAL